MKEIKAREGFYLTQIKEVEDRIFVKALKGANLKEEDWREATEDEKIEYERSQEQLNEEQYGRD